MVCQHVALAFGIYAGLCSRPRCCAGDGRCNFQTCARYLRSGSRGRTRSGSGSGCDRSGVDWLRYGPPGLSPFGYLVAHQCRSLGFTKLRQLRRLRHTQHRALFQAVDVAADEGLGIGAQQRQHGLVQAVALGMFAGDIGKRLPTLYLHLAIA